jgi:hypothetical protein
VATDLRTDPGDVSLDELRRERLGRRIVLGVLVVFLAAGSLEVFGSKTDQATATAAGFTLTVTYPSVTRPGLPIRWEFDVTHPGGFDQPIRLATTFDYLHLFDISNLEPDAASSTGSGTEVIYVFDPPPGDDFRVSMDGNAEPGFHELPSATTTLLVGDQPVVSVTYATRVVP